MDFTDVEKRVDEMNDMLAKAAISSDAKDEKTFEREQSMLKDKMTKDYHSFISGQ